jgi:hypothetical protein
VILRAVSSVGSSVARRSASAAVDVTGAVDQDDELRWNSHIKLG